MDRGAWWATVHGVAKSWTLLNDQHFHNYNIYYNKSYVNVVSVRISHCTNLIPFHLKSQHIADIISAV